LKMSDRKVIVRHLVALSSWTAEPLSILTIVPSSGV